MSLISEYIKLLPKAIKNPEAIINGWINDIKFKQGNLPEDEIREIIRRRGICYECPFISLKADTSKEYFDIFGQHYESKRPDVHCSICSCLVTKKTANLSEECGIQADEKTRHLEPKWKSYK